ncbi:MAG: cytidine/deoxycytidylate deaminase family protein [Candidatus Nomurabacteria bacterium]|jgi:dCMP deaminase|nr:cytidine/deoxycytidylate deaminase family protein [Candidatus Nomurabacteria bacterium]
MSKNQPQKVLRPDWTEYFMLIMDAVATRGTCLRAKPGCVITRDNVLLSSGYCGAPSGAPQCDEVGCLIEEVKHSDGHISMHCRRTVHAEANAILQAAKNGVEIKGGTLYCGMTPCRNCAMLIVNSGIKKVIAKKDYHESLESKKMFDDAGIELLILNPEVEKYDQQSG